MINLSSNNGITMNIFIFIIQHQCTCFVAKICLANFGIIKTSHRKWLQPICCIMCQYIRCVYTWWSLLGTCSCSWIVSITALIFSCVSNCDQKWLNAKSDANKTASIKNEWHPYVVNAVLKKEEIIQIKHPIVCMSHCWESLTLDKTLTVVN